ncbi:MAG: phospholipase D-like domain-containing protein [Polyangiales bacterium]
MHPLRVLNWFGRRVRPALAVGLIAAGCSGASRATDADAVDGITGGKADGTAFSTCELDAIVELLNDPTTTEDALRDAGVSSKAASNLVLARPFADAEAVDAVRYVGSSALRSLATLVAGECVGTTPPIEVVFSPASTRAQSHLAKLTQVIRGAKKSIDVAVYSFDDATIRDALGKAVDNGLRVRVVFDEANQDRSDPDGGFSAELEERGIDVRYVNKIMHHKFAIVDGPDSNDDDPTTATLVTGSANWSSAAATRYDENTVFIHGNAELITEFKDEFALLWNNSRDFEWNGGFTHEEASSPNPEEFAEDPTVDVAFTSANFRVYESSSFGPTFSTREGLNTVADALVAFIEKATKSIHIASGHLRSREVAEALIHKHEEDPSIDIRIITDGQEYISYWTNYDQVERLETCLTNAGSDPGKREDCTDNNFLFGYMLSEEHGIDVRYKYYAYRWDYQYADQMHNKYFIIDGEQLATGSYNLSENAEHNTIENMMFLDGKAYPTLVDAFERDFERLWTLGKEEGLYDALLDDVEHGSEPFKIVFDPMTLRWSEVEALKKAILAACPDVNSEPFRLEPAKHQTCFR